MRDATIKNERQSLDFSRHPRMGGPTATWLTDSIMQGKACQAAATDVVREVAGLMYKKRGHLTDDTTCMVIDCKPHAVRTFKGYAPGQALQRASGSATSRQGSPDASLHTNVNSGAAGASVHGAYRLPGGVWGQQTGLTAAAERVGNAAGSPSGRHKQHAAKRGLFSCCFSRSAAVERAASTGEVEAAFGSVKSLGGMQPHCSGMRQPCMHQTVSTEWKLATAIGACPGPGKAGVCDSAFQGSKAQGIVR